MSLIIMPFFYFLPLNLLSFWYWVMLAERFFSEHFEHEFVDIFVSVIKAKFTFFQMEAESMFCQVLNQTMCVFAKV